MFSRIFTIYICLVQTFLHRVGIVIIETYKGTASYRVNEVVRKSNILQGKRNAESYTAAVNSPPPHPFFCKQLTWTNMASVYQVMSSLYQHQGPPVRFDELISAGVSDHDRLLSFVCFPIFVDSRLYTVDMFGCLVTGVFKLKRTSPTYI